MLIFTWTFLVIRSLYWYQLQNIYCCDLGHLWTWNYQRNLCFTTASCSYKIWVICVGSSWQFWSDPSLYLSIYEKRLPRQKVVIGDLLIELFYCSETPSVSWKFNLISLYFNSGSGFMLYRFNLIKIMLGNTVKLSVINCFLLFEEKKSLLIFLCFILRFNFFYQTKLHFHRT